MQCGGIHTVGRGATDEVPFFRASITPVILARHFFYDLILWLAVNVNRARMDDVWWLLLGRGSS